ncbi:hypothetical protein BGZ91_009834, partial [Linnemannia elongata]
MSSTATTAAASQAPLPLHIRIFSSFIQFYHQSLGRKTVQSGKDATVEASVDFSKIRYSQVVAIDFSPAQLALCGLKIAAYKTLTYEEFTQLLGFEFAGEDIGADGRVALYQDKVRAAIANDDHRTYWDENLDLIRNKIIHIGRLEKFFNIYRNNGIRNIPIWDNYYAEYVFTGQQSGNNGLPDYLVRENYEIIRSRIDRVKLVHADVLKYLNSEESGHFDGYNLSDIFEWMSEDLFKTFLTAIHNKGTPDARICYWNLF